MWTVSAVASGLFLALLLCHTSGHDFKGFDDTILFQLDWPGELSAESNGLLEDQTEGESYFVTTANKEKYKCIIPQVVAQESETEMPYIGPSSLELIQPLFSPSVCSYRIESYWTYELCHGHYIKQYHEEREGKSFKLQEYYIGKWDTKKTDVLKEQLAEAEKRGDKLRYKKIDGLNLPYIEIAMSDGTMCEIINEPRMTKVLYVCYAHGKNEIYSLKETSTCNYEVIVLTPALCVYPKFKPKDTNENTINCLPVKDAPKKPKSMVAMEFESMKMRYQKLADLSKSVKDTIAVFKVDKKDGTLRMEIIQGDLGDKKEEIGANESPAESHQSQPIMLSATPKDTAPVDAFLQGKNCLTGGAGWWKYEFCYGRYVRQFHIDKMGETSLLLGSFDKNLHKAWIDKNTHKKPKPKEVRTQITHFYQGGTFCEKTNALRQTEVKLKCLENSSSPATVSLYLFEPETCQYVLGVESPLICDILHKVDDYGLIPETEAKNDDSESTGKYVGDAVVESIAERVEN